MSRKWLIRLVVAALTLVAGCTTTDGQPGVPSPELPQQTLLTSSMREQPVPGWTVTVAELGLPSGAGVRPLANTGDRGIFLGITTEAWWVLGIDVTSGQRTFGPLRIATEGASSFDCLVNGPPDVLCVRQMENLDDAATAFVIDTETGAVIHEGPTELKVAWARGRPGLEQVGDRAIAVVEGEGVHGVGRRGELTWFVPGDGILASQFAFWDHDTPRPDFAMQGSGDGTSTEVVFSTVDGKTVKPSLPPDARQRRAMVYPGAIGYEYSVGVSENFVAFFDDSGARLSEPIPGEDLAKESLDMPMVITQANYRVLTVDGRQLVELPRTSMSPQARLIGSRLFVTTDEGGRQWQQFDLRSGAEGRTCDTDSLGFDYIGSDGEVAVTALDGGLAQGLDLSTCETLWTLPDSESGSAEEIWRINRSLIQRSGDALFKLVAPG